MAEKRELASRRGRTRKLTGEMLDCLAGLVEDITARRAVPSDDPERDVKLVAQVLKAIEQLEALNAGEPVSEATPRDHSDGGASGGPSGDAELRAALERRFAELCATGDGDGVSAEPVVTGA